MNWAVNTAAGFHLLLEPVGNCVNVMGNFMQQRTFRPGMWSAYGLHIGSVDVKTPYSMLRCDLDIYSHCHFPTLEINIKIIIFWTHNLLASPYSTSCAIHYNHLSILYLALWYHLALPSFLVSFQCNCYTTTVVLKPVAWCVVQLTCILTWKCLH